MPAFSVSPLVLLILLLSLLPPSCCAAPSSSCSAYSLACWGVDCGAGYSCTACTADDDGFPQPTCESISDSSSALTSAVLFGVVVASLCGLVIIGSAIAISVRVGLCCWPVGQPVRANEVGRAQRCSGESRSDECRAG